MPDLKDGQAFETWLQTVRTNGLSLVETVELGFDAPILCQAVSSHCL